MDMSVGRPHHAIGASGDQPGPPSPRARWGRPTVGARVAAVAVGALVALSGCSSDGGPSACGEVEVDPIDPQSVVHVLPGAPDPDDADPLPTSGVHVMDPRVAVVSDEPLPRAIAVGVLERSGVVIEYRSDLTSDEVAELESLASEEQGTVVVAPNDALPSPVLARAWRHRMTCDAADTDALAEFVGAHLGTGSAMTSGTG